MPRKLEYGGDHSQVTVCFVALLLFWLAGLAYAEPQEIMGKDGAPMVLVPAGEFQYSMVNGMEGRSERPSLSEFYIDKFEVSARQYSQFLQSTGRRLPDDWPQQLALVTQGDRPVVNVTWDDAQTYCRHYGKRLPSDQEWEKAARGSEGRRYPWGSEEPTTEHALFDMKNEMKWNGYETLALVNSYEKGVSPYGVYNMLGNVWEWTSTKEKDGWFEPTFYWYRGGSWGVYAMWLGDWSRIMGTTNYKSTNLGFRCKQTS